MSISICTCCLETCQSCQAFCGYCGARLQAESEIEKLRRRLQVIRAIVRGGSLESAHGIHALRKQVASAVVLLATPGIREDARAELLLVEHDLARLESEPNLPQRIAVGKACLELWPENEVPRLRQQLAQLETLVKELRETEKTLAAGGMQPSALNAWWKQAIERAGLSAGHAVLCALKTPQYWPRLATSFDASAQRRAQLYGSLAQAAKGLQAKEYEFAAKQYDLVLRADPNCIAGWEGLGFLHSQRQDIPAAIDAFRRAMVLGTKNAVVHNELAWKIVTATAPSPDDVQTAVVAAYRAVELAPVAGQWDTLSAALALAGDLPGALVACRESLNEDPDRAEYQTRMTELIQKWHSSLAAGTDPESEADSELYADNDLEADFNLDLDLSLDSGTEEASGVSIGDRRPKRSEDSDCFSLSLDDQEESSDSEESESLALCADDSESFALDDEGSLDCDDEECEAPARMVERVRDEKLPGKAAARTKRGAFAKVSLLRWLTKRDDVDCTVFSPPAVALGEEFMVQVFAHLPGQKAEARQSATQYDEAAKERGSSALATQIARGSELTFELSFPRLNADAPPEVESLIWQGRTCSVQFVVSVPDDAKQGDTYGTVVISQDSVPIGHIRFKVTIDADLDYGQRAHPAGEATRYQRAFCSYASPDRAEVLRRVQMLKAVGIETFQDVLDLDPGDRWRKELHRHMDEADVMFLFWSSHAKASAEVANEWRYGLKTKGEDFIRPVIIEGPPVVTPPEELSHLHFNDRVMYFLKVEDAQKL